MHEPPGKPAQPRREALEHLLVRRAFDVAAALVEVEALVDVGPDLGHPLRIAAEGQQVVNGLAQAEAVFRGEVLILAGTGLLIGPDTTEMAESDCVVIVTDHSTVDYQLVADHASLVLDTRGTMRNMKGAARVVDVFAKRLQVQEKLTKQIADALPISRPAVSQHLKVLKDARLVTARAEGTRRLYAVDQRGIETVRDWLDGFWDETLAAFKDAAEREAAKERKSK